MALTYESIGEALDTSGTSSLIYCPKPTGTAADDLLVASFVTIRGGAASATHTYSGFTLIREITISIFGGAYTTRLGLYYKIAGDSESANYLFESSNTCSAIISQVQRYSGVDTTTPYHTYSEVSNADSTAITFPAITTTSANELLFGSIWSIGAGTATSFSSSDFTERWDAQGQFQGDSLKSTAGSSGTKTVTAADSGANIGIMAAFNSAVVSTNTTLTLIPASLTLTGQVLTLTTETPTSFAVVANTSSGFSIGGEEVIIPMPIFAYYYRNLLQI